MTVDERAQPSFRAHTTLPSSGAVSHVAAPRFPSPAARVRRWQRAFATLLAVSDTAVVAIAVFTAQLLRFGGDGPGLAILGRTESRVTLTYTMVSAMIIVGWLVTLRIFDSRDYRVIGSGTDEYKRVTNATIGFFGVAAIAAFLIKAPIGRGYLLLSLPLGWVLLMLSRWLWRQWLAGRRGKGRLMSHAVVVGDRASARHVAAQIQKNASAGIKIIGAITEGGSTERSLTDAIPVLGEWGRILDHVDRARADTVIVTGNHSLTPRQLRELGWGLQHRRASLIVAPALTDVAGPRIHSRPVAGLPLIHVDYPELTGIRRFLKRAFDLCGATGLLLLASPVMLIVALAVKTTSNGPLFYGQQRIGRNGTPFKMWKFRSMVVGADDQLKSLLDAQGTSDKPLFKVQNDPRITPVGHFIRRYSLDELPQFFNVLNGTMSLVGPRPQVAAEVALYEGGAHRRLLMRPGISGLWQVSGRSNLDWDDAIRLDLYYVENWSLMTDVITLWRTLRAVLAKDGAY